MSEDGSPFGGEDWMDVVRRRFGSAHTQQCARPSVVTCANSECQKLNHCRLLTDEPANHIHKANHKPVATK